MGHSQQSFGWVNMDSNLDIYFEKVEVRSINDFHNWTPILVSATLFTNDSSSTGRHSGKYFWCCPLHFAITSLKKKILWLFLIFVRFRVCVMHPAHALYTVYVVCLPQIFSFVSSLQRISRLCPVCNEFQNWHQITMNPIYNNDAWYTQCINFMIFPVHSDCWLLC